MSDSPTTLIETFEKQVEKSPDSIALRFEESVLSYREMNQRVNQLAHYLIPLISEEEPVAICMERCIEMVISIYAVIKAGGAYVPMEPDHPLTRQEYMIKNTGARIILTQNRYAEKLSAIDAKLIFAEELQAITDSCSIENPNKGITPENLAYIIYTSGTTGNPKGVMNEHGGIMNRLAWMQEELRLTPQDKVLQKTPYTFDVSVWGFFWPLQIGATLVIAKPRGHVDSTYLVQIIQQQEITTIHFVPSMLKHFLENRHASECRSIKRVICSGEALRPDHKNRFYEVLPEAELYNMYGPTEAAVDVTSYFCDPRTDETNIPIGRPMDHVEIRILNEAQQDVPAGETGEIYLGGIQVARGYINAPELTAKAFISDPAKPEGRLYKTGDLGRYRPDGNIEYLGRMDFQVKIRGIRVELSEIEQHLNRQPGIQDCVVTVWTDSAEESRLIAYYCEREPHAVHPETLKATLGKELPEFMVPEFFIQLPAIPLSSNGKVDRKALPDPEFHRSTSTEFIAPETSHESLISDIWKQVLQIDEVGIDDSFFDVGGNSFLLMRVLSELNNRYSKEISLMDLFTYPTIRKLSEHLSDTGNIQK